MNTLPNSSSPYDSLSAPVLTDLITIVHFTLLFSEELKLRAHDLLFPKPEKSLLDAEGAVFKALTHHISVIRQKQSDEVEAILRAEIPETRLASIAYGISECGSEDTFRSKVITADGRVTNSARLRAGVRDGCGTGYVWVRGADGCASGRVVACGRVWAGEDLRHVSEAIDIRGRSGGGRADLLVAVWLRERADKSMARASRVLSEWEQECALRKEQELERERRLSSNRDRMGLDTDGCVLVAGEKISINNFGRGKRERRSVNYVEKRDEFSDGDNYTVLEDKEIDRQEDEDEDDGEEEDEFVVDSPDTDDDDGTADDDQEQEGTDGGDPQEADDEKIEFEEYDVNNDGYVNKKGRKRLRRGEDGGWARRVEPLAVGRTRVVSMDFELGANSSSRAARAARRSELRALQV